MSSARAAVTADEMGFDVALHVGPLLPAVREPGRGALRVLDAPRGVGGGDEPDRARPAGRLHRLPEPAPARGHRPHRRPRQRRPRRSSASAPAGRAATTTSTGSSSAPWASASPPSARAIPEIQRRLLELNPPPVRRMPILIAGTGERKTLRLVAQYADGWHAAFPDRPEELVPAVEALTGWCAEIGRDPHDIEWGLGVEPEDLDRFLREDADRYVELGLHAVHARVQRAGLDGRSGRRLAGLARRAKPVTSWRRHRVGSGHERDPPAGPPAALHARRVRCAASAACRRRTPSDAWGR